eukprot:Rmarinus@m.14314
MANVSDPRNFQNVWGQTLRSLDALEPAQQQQILAMLASGCSPAQVGLPAPQVQPQPQQPVSAPVPAQVPAQESRPQTNDGIPSVLGQPVLPDGSYAGLTSPYGAQTANPPLTPSPYYSTSVPPPAPPPAPTPAVPRPDDGEGDSAAAVELDTREIFSTYKSTFGFPHPGEVVEAVSLAHVSLPHVPFTLDWIPDDVMHDCKLSGLQLETVLYASHRHRKILPSGERAAFFVGDGAGVGKGRQIVGVILDNYVRGRKKHLWFSTSSDLKLDAQRDVKDVGCRIRLIEGIQDLQKRASGGKLSRTMQDGILFNTYATLISKGSAGRESRLQQIIEWCGKDFDGCLVFDECHKAKNYIPENEKASTKAGMAVVQLQEALPMARVVYCSATGISEIQNMAFMYRLGLWGPGTPFQNFKQFLSPFGSGSLGALEMLSMELKMAGAYLSRTLSFRNAEFCMLEAEITDDQAEQYRNACNLWVEMLRALQGSSPVVDDDSDEFEAKETRSVKNSASASVMRQLWSTHQRFFKCMCIGMKVPTMVKDIKKSLDEGYSIVIGLQSTGEAALERAASLMSRSRALVSTARECIVQFATLAFSSPKRDDFIERARQLDLPPCPLDEVIEELGGPSKVAELTGRRTRMVRTGDSFTCVPRASQDGDLDMLNVREKELFMKGQKLIAIISDAASTGLSLHADQRAGNQRRRIHYTLELAWSADKAIQQLGRSHRSNQVSAPIYKLLMLNLGGDKRFASAIAQRLESLGALTKGDRRAASGMDLLDSNFFSPTGRKALQQMYATILDHQAPIDFVQLDDNKASVVAPASTLQAELASYLCYMDLIQPTSSGRYCLKGSATRTGVKKFLNRLLGLPIEGQRKLFNYYCEIHDRIVENAKLEGTYDIGVTALKGQVFTLENEAVLFEHPNGTQTKVLYINADRGFAWEDVRKRALDDGVVGTNFFTPTKSAAGTPVTNKAGKVDDSDDESVCDLTTLAWAADDDEANVQSTSVTPAASSGPSASKPSNDGSSALIMSAQPYVEDSAKFGFYRGRQPYRDGHPFVAYLTYDRYRNRYMMIRPHLGKEWYDEPPMLLKSYRKVHSPDDVEPHWKFYYDKLATVCQHMPCSIGPRCEWGKRIRRHILLAGGIVPIWSTLERYCPTGAQKKLTVTRVQIGTQTHVGVLLNEPTIPDLRNALENRREQMQASVWKEQSVAKVDHQLVDRVFRKGASAQDDSDSFSLSSTLRIDEYMSRARRSAPTPCALPAFSMQGDDDDDGEGAEGEGQADGSTAVGKQDTQGRPAPHNPAESSSDDEIEIVSMTRVVKGGFAGLSTSSRSASSSMFPSHNSRSATPRGTQSGPALSSAASSSPPGATSEKRSSPHEVSSVPKRVKTLDGSKATGAEDCLKRRTLTKQISAAMDDCEDAPAEIWDCPSTALSPKNSSSAPPTATTSSVNSRQEPQPLPSPSPTPAATPLSTTEKSENEAGAVTASTVGPGPSDPSVSGEGAIASPPLAWDAAFSPQQPRPPSPEVIDLCDSD